MRNVSKEELNEILESHELWLRGEGGKRADLSDTNLEFTDLRYAKLRYANLSYANLRCVNLSNADLSNVNLKHANLENANLENADLKHASLIYADLIYTYLKDVNLRNADLSDTNLKYASLNHANLEDVNLKYADLRYANLKCADLGSANLKCADLRGANLEYVKTNIHTIGYNLACPEEGSFIGYKKANECIIKLLVLEDAKRSSATTTKCRCSKAKVLDIENIKTGEKIKEISSNYDNNFVYEVGKIVTVNDFDEDRWNECATGIHFFMNKDNAINY